LITGKSEIVLTAAGVRAKVIRILLRSHNPKFFSADIRMSFTSCFSAIS